MPGRLNECGCPKCGSDNTISVPLAYGSGTSKTESLSVYVGTKENYGLIPTFGQSQTAIARLLAPPAKKVPGQDLGAGVAFGALLSLVGAVVLFSSVAAGFGIIAVGVLIVIFAWKERSREAQEYNQNVWQPLREKWERSFLCQRCGTVFIPADSASADF